ncbi:MAG TPA: Xaa-Pro peptidase family protein [Anaerolineales bacterium]|nr:Xaa-Pro peptidase family protein [Anaerolineales bacterium]
MSTRLEKLHIALAQAGLDAVVVNPGPTLTYLTGLKFHLMERPVVLLVAPGKDPVIVLPELEYPKVNLFPYRVNAMTYGENPAEWNAVFRKALQSLGLDGKKIGVEPRQLRLLEFQYVRAGAPEADFPDASEALASLRLRKDQSEVEAMRRAVHVAQDALEATIPLIKIGMTEKEIASELTLQMLRRGSEAELPFPPIVSAGPNSANPHASPSERKLQLGDLLVVDWGATVDGYISDLTRTFAVGAVEPEFKKIAEIVLRANEAGRAAGRPGVPCANVDQAAREVIERAGYGKYFTHRTGHGIGMEGHEEPYMRGDNMQMLYPGMAYTVEPGIYLPERNGVRIEDNVVVTKDGVEVLSDMPRELRIVG